MILDDLKNSSLYHSMGPLFKKAFEFTAATDMKTLPLGKHEIQGEDLFVILMEYETKDPQDCIMETHRKYCDIQLMLRGEEFMGIKTFNGQTPSTPYDESKDAAFYQPQFDSLVKVKEGQFTIFFPHDLHMPSMKTGSSTKILKAVFKVKVV
ncbi:MAG TPA: YhcH/YjgK/YiaL family protein [Chryseosolibacter sp.]